MVSEPGSNPRQICLMGNVEVLRIKVVARSSFFALTYQKHGELSSNPTGRHCPSEAL